MNSERTMYGTLVLVSGPSGAGKNTIIKEVIARHPRAKFVVSKTTRKPRSYEVQGKDYDFVTEAEFRASISADDFLEYEVVHGKDYYGTPRGSVLRDLEAGFVLIHEIDVKGAAKIRAVMPHTISVFVLPPGETLADQLSSLEFRLRGRKSETEDQIKRRLVTAEEELPRAREFPYQIVNTDLEEAIQELLRVIYGHKPAQTSV